MELILDGVEIENILNSLSISYNLSLV